MIIFWLELIVVIVVVCIDKMLKFELDVFIDEIVFWIDSMVVIWYIRNILFRFYIFVVNRFVVIYEGFLFDEWWYINIK